MVQAAWTVSAGTAATTDRHSPVGFWHVMLIELGCNDGLRWDHVTPLAFPRDRSLIHIDVKGGDASCTHLMPGSQVVKPSCRPWTSKGVALVSAGDQGEDQGEGNVVGQLRTE